MLHQLNWHLNPLNIFEKQLIGLKLYLGMTCDCTVYFRTCQCITDFAISTSTQECVNLRWTSLGLYQSNQLKHPLKLSKWSVIQYRGCSILPTKWQAIYLWIWMWIRQTNSWTMTPSKPRFVISWIKTVSPEDLNQ